MICRIMKMTVKEGEDSPPLDFILNNLRQGLEKTRTFDSVSTVCVLGLLLAVCFFRTLCFLCTPDNGYV
jgi:hypothetical protein